MLTAQGPVRAAVLACTRAVARVDKRAFAMQITIEDLSPVEKRVEFELPWADVAPKLEKAYDSLRRGVRFAGFRPGKVPRALLEKMYRRQVEDEVARDLVDHSLGPGHPARTRSSPSRRPPSRSWRSSPASPFKFSARVEVRSQVTPKDYSRRRRCRAGPPR